MPVDRSKPEVEAPPKRHIVSKRVSQDKVKSEGIKKKRKKEYIYFSRGKIVRNA